MKGIPTSIKMYEYPCSNRIDKAKYQSNNCQNSNGAWISSVTTHYPMLLSTGLDNQ
jgi:hypothetical protein